MKKYLVFLPLLAVLAGCPVTQSQDTPVKARHFGEGRTGRGYWLYVPSYYDRQQDWPLVVTLHGTYVFDSGLQQISEWKALAEQQGFIVVAPALRSVQGVVPVVESLRQSDLAKDEEAVLAVIDEVCRNYRIDPKAVLLTGFSAGGYPLYYIGLRNPSKFDMLIARACNSSMAVFEQIELTDAVRDLPVMIFWGKSDLSKVQSQSWQAFRWLREHRCFNARRKEIKGGHLRRPDVAWQYWSKRLPPRHRAP